MNFWRKLQLLIITLTIAIIVVISGLVTMNFFLPNSIINSVPALKKNPKSLTKTEAIQSITTHQITNSKPLLKHFPYQETNSKKLTIIASYGIGEYQRFEQLNQEAARELMKLIYTARNEGIWIVVISGFRTIKQQQILWDAQVEKSGSEEKAAQFNAPPGYSEHHTGYAVDLGDGKFPNLDLTQEFENTTAFKWLKIHAKEYGFEISFPVNNSQGISYEPWHWRFIKSSSSKAVFANAKNYDF
ncbi:D-alanyl-D-alanine carboxypeptidase family protein [Okeania sp. SIO1I7]|uniref:M15 family metallopeptidase n=1 Tax=Okeania sp. SIO1I7 TaxID=2607772 RepID=UPI0013F95B06|nr:M15 family metallopeptidase [Okeania sp. SIO1I7]NET27806.1 M15 family metallopeptidase [Okeania sp. SIO1I7]